MAKAKRKEIQPPLFQAGNHVSTRYGIGVVLHSFIGSIHYNRKSTYSIAIKGLRKPKLMLEKELSPLVSPKTCPDTRSEKPLQKSHHQAPQA